MIKNKLIPNSFNNLKYLNNSRFLQCNYFTNQSYNPFYNHSYNKQNEIITNNTYKYSTSTNTNNSQGASQQDLSVLNGRLFKNRLIDSKIESMIRVNQAGEQGAVIIAKGQKFILGNDPTVDEILSQEKEHMRDFTIMARERRVRPTIVSPVWHVLGFGLGMVSASLGRNVAMVVHEAVEDVISDHYNEQLRTIHEIAKEMSIQDLKERGLDYTDEAQLLENQRLFEKQLRALIMKCRDEEIHHKELAVENNSRDAPFYDILYNAISMGCKSAVWISKRI